MKTSKPRKRRSHPAPVARSKKSKGSPSTVGEYLARVPQPARSRMKQLRAAIRSVVPGDATEVISYGIPAFRRKKIIVWYAAFSNHCSLFPTRSVIELFAGELKDFSTSKGTVHFPHDKPLPAQLIKKMVKARVEQANG